MPNLTMNLISDASVAEAMLFGRAFGGTPSNEPSGTCATNAKVAASFGGLNWNTPTGWNQTLTFGQPTGYLIHQIQRERWVEKQGEVS
jgi:hypothetical protein